MNACWGVLKLPLLWTRMTTEMEITPPRFQSRVKVLAFAKKADPKMPKSVQVIQVAVLRRETKTAGEQVS